MKSISVSDINNNVFDLIGKGWMLVTAGDEQKVNTMTASWGALGVIWKKPAATVYLRPQRYTKEFVDAHDTFSLNFFGSGFRDEFTYLGSVSGRDEDKIAKVGLTTAFADGTPYFEEASMVLVCRKAYAQTFEESCFIDKNALVECYPDNDLHTLYIGYIEQVLVQE